MSSSRLKNMVLTAFFIALALLLPFLTGQIPQIGSMLSPMHIPCCCAASSADGPGA